MNRFLGDLARVRRQHLRDLQLGYGEVALPRAPLARRSPHAGRD